MGPYDHLSDNDPRIIEHDETNELYRLMSKYNIKEITPQDKELKEAAFKFIKMWANDGADGYCIEPETSHVADELWEICENHPDYKGKE